MSDPGYTIVAFDRDRHGPFVLDSFHRSVRASWPWDMVAAHLILNEFKYTLASPDSRKVVAVSAEDPDTILGWAVGVPARNEITYAFVKYALRRMGLGSALVGAAGVDLSRPTPLRFWTRAAERVSQRAGYGRLYFRVADPDARTKEEAEWMPR